MTILARPILDTGRSGASIPVLLERCWDSACGVALMRHPRQILS